MEQVCMPRHWLHLEIDLHIYETNQKKREQNRE